MSDNLLWLFFQLGNLFVEGGSWPFDGFLLLLQLFLQILVLAEKSRTSDFRLMGGALLFKQLCGQLLRVMSRRNSRELKFIIGCVLVQCWKCTTKIHWSNLENGQTRVGQMSKVRTFLLAHSLNAFLYVGRLSFVTEHTREHKGRTSALPGWSALQRQPHLSHDREEGRTFERWDESMLRLRVVLPARSFCSVDREPFLRSPAPPPARDCGCSAICFRLPGKTLKERDSDSWELIHVTLSH